MQPPDEHWEVRPDPKRIEQGEKWAQMQVDQRHHRHVSDALPVRVAPSYGWESRKSEEARKRANDAVNAYTATKAPVDTCESRFGLNLGSPPAVENYRNAPIPALKAAVRMLKAESVARMMINEWATALDVDKKRLSKKSTDDFLNEQKRLITAIMKLGATNELLVEQWVNSFPRVQELAHRPRIIGLSGLDGYEIACNKAAAQHANDCAETLGWQLG